MNNDTGSLQKQGSDRGPIRLLLADDSLIFRRFLADIFADCSDLQVVGEADNGVTALDMLLKSSPDVILLDLEMPVMDGMTALQHLMIRRPTPTIIFSSLSEDGTARSFDTMKNGAVDFLCKKSLLHNLDRHSQRQSLVDKVRKAARMTVRMREPVFSPGRSPVAEQQSRFVFCEECGGRELVGTVKGGEGGAVVCRNCGDLIDISLSTDARYRRNTFLTVVGGGDGCYGNLLEIVPKLPTASSAALLVQIRQDPAHVDGFCDYLDAVSAMRIVRARAGVHLEGGNCYITASQDSLAIKPFVSQPTLQKITHNEESEGFFDSLLGSVAAVYRHNAAGVVLSGGGADGRTGMPLLLAQGGTALLLHPDDCFNKEMGEQMAAACPAATFATIPELVARLCRLHDGSGGPVG